MLPNINKPEITVNMLGEFSITINGSRIPNLKGRTKRVWLLIQYLIANRYKDISFEMLEKVLWEDGGCGEPQNALKNLVYRARELLKDLSGDSHSEFIEYDQGVYKWNNNYPCTVDTEQLVDCWKLVKDSAQPDKVRVTACKKVLLLYRGEFLPKSSYSPWVVYMSEYYAFLYNDCVLNGCNVLIEHRSFDGIIHLCETALVHTPLEETIHKMLLYAYICSNRRDKALEHYHQTAELFYRELGVDISESLLPLYKQLINGVNHAETDLNLVKTDLEEDPNPNGAYYCDYDAFKTIYRAQARMMMRTGLSIFVVLFTVSHQTGEEPGQQGSNPVMGKLKEAILSSLRKGDVVSSYSATQYIVMLPVISYENTQIVTDRILQRFRFLYRKSNVKVITAIESVNTVE